MLVQNFVQLCQKELKPSRVPVSSTRITATVSPFLNCLHEKRYLRTAMKQNLTKGVIAVEQTTSDQRVKSSCRGAQSVFSRLFLGSAFDTHFLGRLLLLHFYFIYLSLQFCVVFCNISAFLPRWLDCMRASRVLLCDPIPLSFVCLCVSVLFVYRHTCVLLSMKS